MTARVDINPRPIIGVLTVPTYKTWSGDPAPTRPSLGPDGDAFNCYIPAGYVKMIEAGGARAALIPCDGDWDEFTQIVESLNGFLFSGMYTDYVTGKPDCAKTTYGLRGEYIINHVFDQNAAGIWLPLFAGKL